MRTGLLAAACLALSGCAGSDGLLDNWMSVYPTADASSYVESAAAYDSYALQAGELALTQAQRPDVRAYAARLVEEQRDLLRRLADAAAEANVAPPAAALTGAQARALATLQGASIGNFDTAFLRQQESAHEAAIRLHHAYALRGDTEPLRRAAAVANGRAHQHLVDVERMRRLIDLES